MSEWHGAGLDFHNDRLLRLAQSQSVRRIAWSLRWLAVQHIYIQPRAAEFPPRPFGADILRSLDLLARQSLPLDQK